MSNIFYFLITGSLVNVILFWLTLIIYILTRNVLIAPKDKYAIIVGMILFIILSWIGTFVLSIFFIIILITFFFKKEYK